MSRKDKLKLIAADTLARVVVYGPLAVAAIYFSPISLIVLGLAAAQPWLGEGIGVAATWLEKKFPKVMVPVDRLISKYAGMPWWKHAGVLIAALAVATVPTPAIAQHLPGFLKTLVGAAGGADSIWSQYVLPFALVTALPFATRMATDGFEWIFQKIPSLRDASIQRQQNRRDRAAAREAERSGIRAAQRRGAPAVDSAAAPAVEATPGPAVLAAAPEASAAAAPDQPRLETRRVDVGSKRAVVVTRPHILPEVVRLSTPPRVEVPQPRSTILDRDVAF